MFWSHSQKKICIYENCTIAIRTTVLLYKDQRHIYVKMKDLFACYVCLLRSVILKHTRRAAHILGMNIVCVSSNPKNITQICEF